MAITGFPGDDDPQSWIQTLMNNMGPGQNGYAPGGAGVGWTPASGGGPNMGYPASPDMGPYSPQATGAPQPQPQSGYARYLAALNPISSAQAGESKGAPFRFPMPPSAPSFTGGAQSNAGGFTGLPGQPPVAQPSPGGLVNNAGRGPVMPSPVPTAMYNGGSPGPLASGSGYGGVPPSGWDAPAAGPMDPSIIARQRLAAVNPSAVAATPRPGAGAGPGRSVSGPVAVPPTATANAPAAAPAPSRFTMVDRPNMSANAGPQGGGGPPQMTALNLAGLFGGGQSQAAGVNPAATARVPGPLATGRQPGGRYINQQPPGGPLDYGMLPVDITGYPVAGVNAALNPQQQRLRAGALANAGRRSGYQ